MTTVSSASGVLCDCCSTPCCFPFIVSSNPRDCLRVARRSCTVPGAHARQAEMLARAPKNSMRSPAQRRALSWGSGQYYTDSIGQRAQARARSRRHHKTSEPHLYFPRRRRAFQSERMQRACPPIGPLGRTGTMPRMRRGDLDQTGRTYERTRRRTPHVRMQAMPRATSIHRRSREQNDSCDATLAGRSPTPLPSNRLAENPGSLTGRGYLCVRQFAGSRLGACCGKEGG
jgi:hypothetical protein